MKGLDDIDPAAPDDPSQLHGAAQGVGRVDAPHRNVMHGCPGRAHVVDERDGAEIEHHDTAFERTPKQMQDELGQVLLGTSDAVEMIDSEKDPDRHGR